MLNILGCSSPLQIFRSVVGLDAVFVVDLGLFLQVFNECNGNKPVNSGKLFPCPLM